MMRRFVRFWKSWWWHGSGCLKTLSGGGEMTPLEFRYSKTAAAAEKQPFRTSMYGKSQCTRHKFAAHLPPHPAVLSPCLRRPLSLSLSLSLSRWALLLLQGGQPATQIQQGWRENRVAFCKPGRRPRMDNQRAAPAACPQETMALPGVPIRRAYGPHCSSKAQP